MTSAPVRCFGGTSKTSDAKKLPEIANVIEKQGMYKVYDAKGNNIGSISTGLDSRLHGFTSTSFTIKRRHGYVIYDAKGNQIRWHS